MSKDCTDPKREQTLHEIALDNQDKLYKDDQDQLYEDSLLNKESGKEDA
jgi:hypothetical protein